MICKIGYQKLFNERLFAPLVDCFGFFLFFFLGIPQGRQVENTRAASSPLEPHTQHKLYFFQHPLAQQDGGVNK